MSHVHDGERDLSLRELAAKVFGFRELMDEREKRHTTEREAAEKFAAATSSAAMAAAKKAEDAQNAYNVMHNDLSRKNELMMTRVESEGKFQAAEQKHEELRREVIALRESRSQLSGVTGQRLDDKSDAKWFIGLAIVIGLAVAGWIIRGH